MKLLSANNHTIAFEIAVGFVMWKKKFIPLEENSNRISANDLSPVTNGHVIRKGQFTQAHKGKETAQKLGNKQQIIMIR